MIDLNAQASQQEVVGVLINHGATISASEICNTLSPEAFTVPLMRLCFEALSSQMSKGADTDLISITNIVERVIAKEGDSYSDFGGNAFGIISSTCHGTSLSDASGHASHLKKCLSIRKMQSAIAEANESILTGGDIDEITSSLDKVINSAENNQSQYQPTHVSDMVRFYADHLESKMGELGPRIGFEECDKMIGRVQPGNMIIVAARPGHGKTEFACAWALNAAREQGLNVLFLSLEMTKEEIMDRFVAISSNLPSSDLDNPLNLESNGGAGWGLVGKALSEIDKLDITILDEPALTLAKMRSAIKRTEVNTGKKVDLVFCDYIQLMTHPAAKTRIEELTVISKGIKHMAKDYKIPIVQLAQLNRGSEMQQREPRPSDLKECGQLEQDADKIILIHGESDEEKQYNEDLKKILFAKMRQGKRGAVALEFSNGHFYNTGRQFMGQDEIKAIAAAADAEEAAARKKEKGDRVVGKSSYSFN